MAGEQHDASFSGFSLNRCTSPFWRKYSLHCGNLLGEKAEVGKELQLATDRACNELALALQRLLVGECDWFGPACR